jgi:hypothetical protein
MLAFFRALWNALVWTLETALSIVLLPFRAFSAPPGKAAIPFAPASKVSATTSDTDRSHTARRSPALEHEEEATMLLPRQAADVVRWLAMRLRAGTEANVPAGVPSDLVLWARRLTDDQAREAVRAGAPALLNHLSGRQPVVGLPPRHAAGRRDVNQAPRRDGDSRTVESATTYDQPRSISL